MTYKENSNTFLKSSKMECKLPHQLTIRQWNNFWCGVGQIEDSREEIDASQIVGNATKIYTRSSTARELYFWGLARCGDYIYIPDRSNTPDYEWYDRIMDSECQYNSHIVEVCISTGEVIDIDLGSNGDPGSYQQGQTAHIAVIEERKVLVSDTWLDTNGSDIVRIIDFSTQTVEESLVASSPDEYGFTKGVHDVFVIRDSNTQIHLFALVEFFNTRAISLYHKNYTQYTQWEEFFLPFENVDWSMFTWDGRFYDIIDNRYLIIHCTRTGQPYNEDLDSLVYRVEIVYDVETGGTPKIYELLSPWAIDEWNQAWIPYSAPDNTNRKLYSNIRGQVNQYDSRNLEFNPVTGEFVLGTIVQPHFSPSEHPPGGYFPFLYCMSSKEHAYFWDDYTKDFYRADGETKLGNHDIPNDPMTGRVRDFENVCNLLDSNGGGNPLIWFWDFITSTLKAVDITNGSLFFNKFPDGFVVLENPYQTYNCMNILHMGDSLMVITENGVEDTVNAGRWNGTCRQMDFYIIT